MRQIYIICFLLLTAVISSVAQTSITNGSLESWQNVGSNTEEPTQWNSNKTGGGNATSGPQTCFRESSNPHGGLYCARIASGSVFGIVVNGSLATGKVEAPSTNKSEGYIRTIATDPNYAMPFTSRPDSLIFWYRYTKQGSDFPRVEARLHVGNAYAPEAPVNGNHPDSTVNIIARAQWQGPATTVSGWTRIAVPFVYVDNRTPQFILITTTSSGDQTGGTSGSTLWLDDFDVFYTPSIAVGNIQPLTYYLNAATGATITVPYTILGNFVTGNTVSAELSNAGGSFAAPIALGSTAGTAPSTIAGNIPAGTPDGTGYRVRVLTSNPALTSTPNTANITLITVSNSIAPTATQNIAQGSNGTPLAVTETPGASGRLWKFATTSGGPYNNITPIQTGVSYTPNFAIGGTFFVVCETTYPGGTKVTSNEVQIDVVGNNITPAANQSIAVNANGNTLTVNETAPATSREWKYATTQGGPYVSFNPAQTGTTYVPTFSASGLYFVVCQSVINGNTVTSNAVEIEVSTPFLVTGSITGSPFEFSASAPAATVNVPYTVTSAVFQYNNTFFAQLSDASGSFASPVVIGSKADTGSGVIVSTIPANTPSGTAYRIRVVSSSPAINGSNNGVDLVINQFINSITPDTAQTLLHSTNGTLLTVIASQNATHEWKYSTNSGSGYVAFSPPQTSGSYIPNFALPGTYYVICASKNQYNDVVNSNEVVIEVLNGTTITTTSASGAPYLISPSANVSANVTFTTNVIFNTGNEFKAQISDYTGSFASPVEIGNLSGTVVAPITATIPNSLPSGTQYRIRVVSTNPAVIGSDNGTDLAVVPFETSVTPNDTQYIAKNQAGTTLTVTETHPATREWQWSELTGLGFSGFNPPQTGTTYTPQFNDEKVYYVICKSQNIAGDFITSQEIVIVVEEPQSINETTNHHIKMWWSNDLLMLDATMASFETSTVNIIGMNGKLLVNEKIYGGRVNTLNTYLPTGVYVIHTFNANINKTVKLMKW